MKYRPQQQILLWLVIAIHISITAPAVQAASVVATFKTQPLSPPFPEAMGMVIRDPWYEFNTHTKFPNETNYAAQERMGEILAQMGVRWVRLEFHIEGSDVVSMTQVARNDYFINTVAPRHNLKVLGLLGFGIMKDVEPLDLNQGLISTLTKTDPLYGGGVNEYMRVWLDRARMIANRYKGAISAYQILNEQNRLPPEGTAIPVDVAARLHTKFYRFFRQVDRKATGDQTWRDNVSLILGGLHPAGTGQQHEPSDREYLRQLYTTDGFTGYKRDYGRFPIDGLGYHPYPEEIKVSAGRLASLISSRMDQVRSVLVEVGDPQLPFWITEVGYNVGFGKQTESGQAEFLRLTYTELLVRGDIAVIFWFKYEDFPPAEGANAQKWGVVHIPFTSGACPGGYCYNMQGEPSYYRSAFWIYRELAGLPVKRIYMPLTLR